MTLTTINRAFTGSTQTNTLTLTRRMSKILSAMLGNDYIDTIRDFAPLLAWIQSNCKRPPSTLETLVTVPYKTDRMTTAEFGDPRSDFNFTGERETKKMTAYEWSWIKWWMGYSLADWVETGNPDEFLREKVEDLINYFKTLMGAALAHGTGTNYQPLGVTKLINHPNIAGWNVVGDIDRSVAANAYLRNNFMYTGAAGIQPSRALFRVIREAIVEQSRNPQGVAGLQGFCASDTILDIISYYETYMGAMTYSDNLNIGWMGVTLPMGITLNYDPVFDITDIEECIYLLHRDSFVYSEDPRLREEAAAAAAAWGEDPEAAQFRRKNLIRFVFHGRDFKASTVIARVKDLAFVV